jgi:hypothetical protein
MGPKFLFPMRSKFQVKSEIFLKNRRPQPPPGGRGRGGLWSQLLASSWDQSPDFKNLTLEFATQIQNKVMGFDPSYKIFL